MRQTNGDGMKIAHVTATFPPYMAGTGNVCYQQVLQLSSMGHDVTVFTSDYGGPAPQYPAGITVERWKPLVRIGNAPLLPQLAAIRDFDIIHLHYPFFFGAELIRLVHAIRGGRYIVTYHNNAIIPGAIGKLANRYFRVASRGILHNAERVIFPTRDLYENVAGKIHTLDSEKVGIIPNGVDLAVFSGNCGNIRERLGLGKGDRFILFVGALDRAHHYKGLEVALECLKKVLPDHDNLRLVVVGDGELRPHYMNLAGTYGIERNTIFTGTVRDFTELGALYAAAELVVYPTRVPESFGMVLVEAMASKKPVIASNVPGVREVVDDRINGLLAQPGNVDDFSDKIRYVLNNPPFGEELGQNGRKKAEERYSWERIGVSLEEAYREAVR
jgi:glycosyltransferase involved in cell wall biosynthesis